MDRRACNSRPRNPGVSSEFESRNVPSKLALMAIVIALSPLAARAQTPDPQPTGPALDPERPALNPFPAEHDWGFLSDTLQRTDFFDPAKYILLSENPYLFLSLGFEYRIEYEYDGNWM